MDKKATTITAVAVAVVALCRCLAAFHPGVADHLETTLAQAEHAGLSSEDLALLRTMISSLRG